MSLLFNQFRAKNCTYKNCMDYFSALPPSCVKKKKINSTVTTCEFILTWLPVKTTIKYILDGCGRTLGGRRSRVTRVTWTAKWSRKPTGYRTSAGKQMRRQLTREHGVTSGNRVERDGTTRRGRTRPTAKSNYNGLWRRRSAVKVETLPVNKYKTQDKKKQRMIPKCAQNHSASCNKANGGFFHGLTACGRDIETTRPAAHEPRFTNASLPVRTTPTHTLVDATRIRVSRTIHPPWTDCVVLGSGRPIGGDDITCSRTPAGWCRTQHTRMLRKPKRLEAPWFRGSQTFYAVIHFWKF